MDKKPDYDGLEKYFACEVIEQAKKDAKRCFVAWIITLVALIAWIYVFQSYDYVSQDGNGINSYKTEINGDLNNEPEN